MYTVKKLDKTLYDVWDNIVLNSKNGNFLHLIDYFKYHEERFIDESIVIYKKSKAVAIFPANGDNTTLYSHSGLTYAGLIYGFDIKIQDVLDIFDAIECFYYSLGYREIRYKAMPSVFKTYPADEDLYCLYRKNASIYRRDYSAVVKLNSGAILSEQRKRSINKARKNGVIVEESVDFDFFYQLQAMVLKKFNATPVHSAEELSLLHSRFPDKIKLFFAVLNNERVAATIIYDFGHIAHTQYLASNDIGRNNGALDFLLYSLMMKQYSHYEYFSFGISTESDGLVLNNGLVHQKEGFGGRGVVHDFYIWSLEK